MEYSAYDFSYLAPPKEVFNVYHDSNYIHYGEANTQVRKIFANVPYYSYEAQKLREFEEMIAREGIKLPDWWTIPITMKYAYSAKFDLPKCMENLKGYLKWLEEPARKRISEKALKMLKDGLVYMGGRDKQFRPIIILRVDKLDQKNTESKDMTDALCWLLSAVAGSCYIPGKVENWEIIIETGGLSLWSFPFKLLQQIIGITTIGYTSSLDKLYITNPPRLLKASWGLIQKLVHPETAAKISMIDDKEFSQMLEKISPDQLEKRFGGTLPDPEAYWPPINTLNQPPYTPKEYEAYIRSIDPRIMNSEITRERHSVGVLQEAASVYLDFDVAYQDIPSARDGLFIRSGEQRISHRSEHGSPLLERNRNNNYYVPESVMMSYNSSKSPKRFYDDNLELEKQTVSSGCCRSDGRGKGGCEGCSIF